MGCFLIQKVPSQMDSNQDHRICSFYQVHHQLVSYFEQKSLTLELLHLDLHFQLSYVLAVIPVGVMNVLFFN